MSQAAIVTVLYLLGCEAQGAVSLAGPRPLLLPGALGI